MTAVAAGQIAAECGPPPRPAAHPRPVRGYASGKEDYLRRLRKIEGQVRGLQKMIDGDARLGEVAATIRQVVRL